MRRRNEARPRPDHRRRDHQRRRETYESLVDGRGICLLASGNAPSVTRGGVVTRPVNGLPPCQLALAWRRDHHHPLTAAYLDCARQVTDRSS